MAALRRSIMLFHVSASILFLSALMSGMLIVTKATRHVHVDSIDTCTSNVAYLHYDYTIRLCVCLLLSYTVMVINTKVQMFTSVPIISLILYANLKTIITHCIFDCFPIVF